MTATGIFIQGVLLVNKPSGPSSYDMIRWVKKLSHGVKVGHTGTLDPLASGLMILLFGSATKKQAAYMGMDKVYRCRMRLGLKTDSGDITGKPVETKEPPVISQHILDRTLDVFLGISQQEPPMYSAIKVGGVPLYKLARKGQTIERASRTITIHSISGTVHGTEIELRMRCSSGTYVRTLVEAIGEKLGTCATVSALVRENIGPFSLAQAMPGDELRGLDETSLRDRLLPAA